MAATITKGLRRWRIIINPEWYDDAEDIGYSWAGNAETQDEAVAAACAACDIDNDLTDLIEQGLFEATTPANVQVWDCEPDTRNTIRKTLDAFHAALNAAEIAPNGDDFNDLSACIELALQGYVPTITLTKEGR